MRNMMIAAVTSLALAAATTPVTTTAFAHGGGLAAADILAADALVDLAAGILAGSAAGIFPA